MSGERTGGDDRALHEPDTLVRFAWAAQLDAYRTRSTEIGATGRQALANSLGLTEARLSALAAAGGDRLADLVDDMEQRGFAEHGSVTRLVEQVRLRSDAHWDVAPRWWPILRDRYRLGQSDIEPEFASATDVVMAAEAFVSHHRHQLHHPPNIIRRTVAPNDLYACRQLLARLCRLATGPYGVTHDCYRLVARMAPLEPGVIASFVKQGGPRTQMIRAWERSERHTTWNAHLRQEFATLLATPPDRIFRRIYWLRGLRRLRLADLRSDEAHTAERRWVNTQLEFAMRGERGYIGALPTERRYALWVAAEVTADDRVWQRMVAVAETDDLLAELLPVTKALRDHLALVPLYQRDGFWFTPEPDWPVLTSEPRVAEMLDTTFAGSRSWSQYPSWRWARRTTRWMAARLLRDAVLAPCAVRQRSAAETLVAGGPECRQAATRTVAAVLEAERASAHPHPVIVHRCLVVLGMMRHAEAIPAVEAVLQTATGPDGDDRVLAQALGAAAELAAAWPDASTGMVAWACRRARDHADDEETVLAAIPAMVAFRRDPAVELEGVLPDTPAVRASLDWAADVLSDPLLPT